MKFLFNLLVLSFCSVLICHSGLRYTLAKEDEIEDEVVDVENEEVSPEVAQGAEEPENVDVKDTGSVNANLFLLFTKPTFPSLSNIELPAGKQVEFLVGFSNKGSLDFTIETLDASFRFPRDFSYHIQNFTTIQYEKKVKPGYQATLSYSFVPADSFAGRPFGLSINLAYRDEFGTQFYEKVYNDTVNIIEVEEGLDGETFFLYVFLCAGVLLLLVIGQHFLYSVGKKRVGGGSKKNLQLETGTKNKNDIDYDWIPNHLKTFNKSPKVAKNKSPISKARKAKRTAGFDD
ncbi:translocon-associated protein subunit alpha [Planococcus citri]|uniref:translocon-associated protein subunit alpha n=1 Tax=Planococcus citri TaxID=170843 RepID=UPI0031F96976